MRDALDEPPQRTRAHDCPLGGVLCFFQPAGLNPHENKKKLLYEAMLTKPVKEVFVAAFPCVTKDEAETVKLQERFQELVNAAHNPFHGTP